MDTEELNKCILKYTDNANDFFTRHWETFTADEKKIAKEIRKSLKRIKKSIKSGKIDKNVVTSLAKVDDRFLNLYLDKFLN